MLLSPLGFTNSKQMQSIIFAPQLIYQSLPPSLGNKDYNAPAVIDKITLTNLRIRFLQLNTYPGDDLPDASTAMWYATHGRRQEH